MAQATSSKDDMGKDDTRNSYTTSRRLLIDSVTSTCLGRDWDGLPAQPGVVEHIERGGEV